MSKSLPPLPGGATAARMSCPGAMKSGFRMSPPPAVLGPRDENPATSGAGAFRTSVAFGQLPVADEPAPVTYETIAVRAALSTCTAGNECRSAFVDAPSTTLATITPMPPASLTAALLSTRALAGAAPPRSQTTILPATFAGSSCAAPAALAEKHCRSRFGSAPARPTAEAGTIGPETPFVIEAPANVAPLPRVSVVTPLRLCVPAATDASHGLMWATVLAVGPLLPADVATKTPARP